MIAAHTERLFRRDAETSTRDAYAPETLHLPLDFGVRLALSSMRDAERAESDEQLRVHRGAHLYHHRSGRDEPARRSRTRVLPTQRKSARRGSHCPHARDAAAAGFAMVGDVSTDFSC
jgi:hypothetical protein